MTVRSAPSLFADYRPPAGVYDELKGATGVLRPHWAPFLSMVEALGSAGLRERQASAQQLLRDHGVTYNVYADGSSDERPWKLDMLPFLIAPAEWAKLEAGLIQRTRLLDLVLADMYGPQRLVRGGLLPPALLQANPGFIRACHGVRPPGDRWLSMHAVDLTRAPNGEWWVLGDRTQAPSGIGYALENRVVLSRVLPDEFRDANVYRLAAFFLERKAGLRALAPWTDSPHIVLLTPGPYTETYFEHAYIARYLGYPLVEGSDLTVREGKVFIKTIEGLQRVDVIIRRVDDTYCDPVELRTDSFLGVPGLLEAARAGNVAISNALGSGAVEAPVLLAFLPALARHLLGEELRIPNVATWWCGQARERALVLGRLRSLVAKRAFIRGRGAPIFGETLNRLALDNLAEEIQTHPHDFVGQERVAFSTAPVWHEGAIETRPLILRCFVTATAEGYAVFPGGLTRVSASTGSPLVTSTHGGGSKDTWVLAERPVEEVTLLDRRGVPTEVHRSAAMLSSRVVDNLFWLGRYAERLEDCTRLLRTVLGRLAGESGASEEQELAAIVRFMVAMELLPARFALRFRPADLVAALRALVFDKGRAGSVRQQVARIGRLTASLRARFSGDTWRILHQLQAEFPEPSLQSTAGVLIGPLHRLIFQLSAFSGAEMENMTRGQGWRFLDLGRRLERASNMLEILRALMATEPDGGAALVPLLEYSDSTMTYRRRFFAMPELAPTLELLLTDESNPRSVAFQVNALGRHLTDLAGAGEGQIEGRAFGELHTLLGQADVSALATAACAGEPKALEDFLRVLAAGFWSISDALTAHYFSLVVPQAH